MMIGDVCLIHNDAAVAAAAKLLANGWAAGSVGGVGVSPDAARTSESLWNEDPVPLGIGRQRVRAGGLRNSLHQYACYVDHTQHRTRTERRSCRLSLISGGEIVAVVALIEPDLVGAGDTLHTRLILGLCVDDGCGRAAREVVQITAQQEGIEIRCRCTVGTAVDKLDSPGVCRRIERPFDRVWIERIGDQ